MHAILLGQGYGYGRKIGYFKALCEELAVEAVGFEPVSGAILE